MVLLHLLLGIAAVLAWLWSVLAVRYYNPLPIAARVVLMSAVIAAPLVVASAVGWIFAAFAAIGIAGAAAVAWTLIVPRTDLDWAPDQERLPWAEFEGDTVTIHNMRHATYRTKSDYSVRWYSRTYDLNEIETVDYVVEPFGVFRALAHTFLTFGFEGDEHVAISVEVRREKPEIFNPIKGLFRQYELIYVIGDERDLIGLRANVRRDDVHLYPVRATREKVRHLFESMLRRANKLAEEPEFYNTLLNNCATNLFDHMNELAEERVPFNFRVAIPGYSDRFVYNLGLIYTDLPFEEARAAFRINERSEFLPDGPAWSRQIRGRD